MDKKVYVKASEIKGCIPNDLQGILECKVVAYNFQTETGDIVIPDLTGHVYKLGGIFMYANQECTKPIDKGSWSINMSNCTISNNSHVFLVENFEMEEGELKFLLWNMCAKECKVEVNGKEYNLCDTKLYLDKEECLKYEQTKVTFMDGTEKIIGGEFKKFEFTQDQKTCIDKLEAVMAECRDLGLSFGYESSNVGSLLVYLSMVDGAKVTECSVEETTEDNRYPLEMMRAVGGVKNLDGDYYFPIVEKK